MNKINNYVNWRVVFFYVFCNLLILLLVGYGRINFHEILNLGGDTVQVLNFAKSYIDGFGFRYNPRLGYPGVQDNLYWPTFDFSGRLLLWIFGRFTTSAEISYHLLYVAGLCLMTSGALFGFCKLSIRPWLSFVGACAFIATPFFASRALGHDFLALYYGAAFGGTLSMLIASLKREATFASFFRQPAAWICIWFAATSGIYYAFFTCMFTCSGGLLNAAWHRRWPPLTVTLVTVATIMPLTVLTGYGTGIVDVLSGKIPQVSRAAFEQLGLGLNPAEAVASLAAVPGLGWTLDSYKTVLPLIMGVKGLYEWPSAILCIVIFSAPGIVAVLSREERASRFSHWLQIIQIGALFITFGFFYAVRGGISYYFNLLISGDIRGTDRIMPFLTFFAVLILCSLIELSLNLRQRSLGLSMSSAIIAAIGFGLWPNVGALANKQKLILSNSNLMSSISSTRQMLLAKDAAGITTVLQLPQIAWPEQPPVRTFDPYAHQNAYILDRVDAPTRWSYGSALLQPAFQAVQRLVSDHATAGLDQAARDMGFDAILIEKSAYDDGEIGQLRENIESGLEAGCAVFDDEFRSLYALNSGIPNCKRKETLFSRLYGIDFSTSGNWKRFAKSGWEAMSDGSSTWTEGPDANLDLAGLPHMARGAKLTFEVYPYLTPATPRRTVTVFTDARVLATWTFDRSDWTSASVLIPPELTGVPLNLDIRQDETRSPRDLGLGGDPRHLGIAVREMKTQELP